MPGDAEKIDPPGRLIRLDCFYEMNVRKCFEFPSIFGSTAASPGAPVGGPVPQENAISYVSTFRSLDLKRVRATGNH